jgi:hypothetical protein
MQRPTAKKAGYIEDPEHNAGKIDDGTHVQDARYAIIF